MKGRHKSAGVITEIATWAAGRGQGPQPESGTFLPGGDTVIHGPQQRAPPPSSDNKDRHLHQVTRAREGHGTRAACRVSWRRPAPARQPPASFPYYSTWRTPSLLLPWRLSSPTGGINCLSLEPARIRALPLYLPSLLPDSNIQPLCPRRRAQQARIIPLLAQEKLTFGVERGRMDTCEAPAGN